MGGDLGFAGCLGASIACRALVCRPPLGLSLPRERLPLPPLCRRRRRCRSRRGRESSVGSGKVTVRPLSLSLSLADDRSHSVADVCTPLSLSPPLSHGGVYAKRSGRARRPVSRHRMSLTAVANAGFARSDGNADAVFGYAFPRARKFRSCFSRSGSLA